MTNNVVRGILNMLGFLERYFMNKNYLKSKLKDYIMALQYLQSDDTIEKFIIDNSEEIEENLEILQKTIRNLQIYSGLFHSNGH